MSFTTITEEAPMIAAAARRKPCAHPPDTVVPLPGHAERPARPAGAQPLLPLGLLGPGERAEVVVAGERPQGACSCRSEEMGLRAGSVVEMLAGGGCGPLLVKIDGSRLALGRGIAMKILVLRLR
jgi:ferrous iron transport protein A